MVNVHHKIHVLLPQTGCCVLNRKLTYNNINKKIFITKFNNHSAAR